MAKFHRVEQMINHRVNVTEDTKNQRLSLSARAAIFQERTKMTNKKKRGRALAICSLGLSENIELFL